MTDTLPPPQTDDFADAMIIALRRAHQAQVLHRARLVRAEKRAYTADRSPSASNAIAPACGAPPHRVHRSPTQQKGDRYERAAQTYLQQAGLRLVARNLSCRVGEIDLVMLDGEVLVFAEVRARTSDRFGGALASVTAGKQARLKRAAAYWLPILRRRLGQRLCSAPIRCRFDVLAFEGEDLHWVKHAFGAD